MSVEVFCYGCGERGRMDKVGATVLHACGSDDVDLWMGTEEQLRRIAAVRGPEPVFASFMRTADAQRAMPRPTDAEGSWLGYVGTDPEPGWDEYAGPGAHPNPMNAPGHSDVGGRAPTKKQPGTEEQSNLYVYDKHHPNEGYGEGPPDPEVARHGYPNHATSTPFLGRRRQPYLASVLVGTTSGILLTGARCPRCSAPETSLLPDYREHAHWYCQAKCGSLADLDRHLSLDPFRPDPRHPWGSDAYRSEKKVFAGKKNGQVLNRVAVIARVNPGLESLSEIVRLARQSVIQYPEA